MTIVRLIGITSIALMIASCTHTQRAAQPRNSAPLPVHLTNGAMEGPAGAQHLPPHWETFILGTPAAFAIDTSIKHSGGQSIRIDAKEATRSYVWSDKIPCAPGEKIHAGCWIKCDNISSQGALIVIAQFTQPDGSMEEVAKVGVADKTNRDWQLVDGIVKVPATCLGFRLQIGFSYSSGTCWLDDAFIEPQQPLVARLDIQGARVTPAKKTIPVSIINRDGRTGDVTIVTSLGHKPPKNAATVPVTTNRQIVHLTGAGVQEIEAPLDVSFRGEAVLSASLMENDQPVFVENRNVIIPAAIVTSPSIPTHWVIEDGAPRISGNVYLFIPDEQRRTGKLEVKLSDPAGNVKASWSPSHPGAEIDNVYSLSCGNLPEASYTITSTFTPANGEPLVKIQAIGVIHRNLAKVKLNDAGYPVYNGTAIFPLGMFNGGRLEEMGNAGFTVAHSYNSMNWNKGESADEVDNKCREFVDNAGKYGLKVCFLVPRGILQEGEFELFRRRVRMFRNHPAVLCWDEEEEIARGNMKMATLDKIHQIIKEEDPNHPLMIGDSRDVITKVKDRSNFFPLNDMDLGMWWWYPIPLGPKPGSLLEGEELSKTYEMSPPTFLTLRNTDKPIWLGIQSYKKPKTVPGTRFPTPTEYRAQVYIGVIAGAKGLMYYGGYVEDGILSGEEKKKTSNLVEGHWDYVKRLAGEVKEMAPIFMAPSIDAPTVAPANAPISICLKQQGDRLVILAANRNKEPMDVTISSPYLHGGNVNVLTENRAISAEGNSLKDHFDAYAVHAYELAR
jgi:hypothetical protein